MNNGFISMSKPFIILLKYYVNKKIFIKFFK